MTTVQIHGTRCFSVPDLLVCIQRHGSRLVIDDDPLTRTMGARDLETNRRYFITLMDFRSSRHQVPDLDLSTWKNRQALFESLSQGLIDLPPAWFKEILVQEETYTREIEESEVEAPREVLEAPTVLQTVMGSALSAVLGRVGGSAAALLTAAGRENAVAELVEKSLQKNRTQP